jgi:lysophospholipase L1-like esterase
LIDRRIALLLVTLLLVLAASFPHARAEAPCPIPDDLALHGIALPIARDAIVTHHRLVILTFGGARLAGTEAGAREATWPVRLEAELAAALPDVAVTVETEPISGETAADIAPRMPALIEKTGANLVIWGPGGRDVALRLDLKAFLNAVAAGIEAARHGGADLILMDTTFLPSPTRMALIEPYRLRLKQAADANQVPFLPRHDLMRLWIADGTLNLNVRDLEDRQRVVRRLFSCMAESLAQPIAAALR